MRNLIYVRFILLVSLTFCILLPPKNFSQTIFKFIVLDAGHGGIDPGALGYNGSADPNEKDFTLSTLQNADILCSSIGLVVSTRVNDQTLTFSERGDIGNGITPDGFGRIVTNIDDVSAFVSIHFNSIGSQTP
ncbi:MAG: N-acetylmuramoyl-L-alanine amidase [Bacteroidetes bacterium]|nr:N-acetylmuramoyl-L-alanine amidase [Bacteroidota bacterium]